MPVNLHKLALSPAQSVKERNSQLSNLSKCGMPTKLSSHFCETLSSSPQAHKPPGKTDYEANVFPQWPSKPVNGSKPTAHSPQLHSGVIELRIKASSIEEKSPSKGQCHDVRKGIHTLYLPTNLMIVVFATVVPQ